MNKRGHINLKTLKETLFTPFSYNEEKVSYGKTIGLIALFLVAQTLLFFVAGMFNLDLTWSNLLVSVLSLVLLWGGMKRAGYELPSIKKIKKEEVLYALGMFVTMNIVLILYNTVVMNLGLIQGEAENQEILIALSQQIPPYVTVLIMGIIPPIAEELVFRQLLIKYGLGKWPFIGLIVSALIFGGLHQARNVFEFLQYAIMGAMLSYTFLRTRKIETSIMVHLFNNLYAVAMMLLFT